ncbi:hypothetical protein QTG54_004814 [Skeletonema marinoi]|uniref:Uncharacterized protein n=1 Tax=Skeletonema marinoi TaxID=267567 RepID=A0AAD9DE45_9STRA|nr:hypothetical protein QTG54_004814 [Skeletonema marinoi]
MKSESAYKHIDDDVIQKDIGFLHNFLIMVMTQSTSDSDVESVFRQITYNMSSIASYFEPLKGMHFSEMAEAFIEINRSHAGLQVQKALSLLNVLVVTHVLFEGKVPHSYAELRRFRQMQSKKTNITMNTDVRGEYVQIGKDRHVNSFLKACGLVTSMKEDDLLYITQTMDKDPGAFFNELCGEIKQAFNDRKNPNRKGAWCKWKRILEEVAADNKIHQKIINKWMGGISWKEG